VSHSAGHPHRRLALPFVASLALGLAALPALTSTPGAHAATTRLAAHGRGGHATHAKPLQAHATIMQTFLPTPSPAPTTSIVVTNCTSTGLNTLSAALQTSATISFNCGAGGGPHVINLGDTFKVTNGEVLTIDGSDGGRNDIVLTGGATPTNAVCPQTPPNLSTNGHQIFYVDFGSSLTLNNLTLTDGYAYSGDRSGGAVEAFGDFSATRDTFSYNGAYLSGGALELSTASSSSAQRSAITNTTFDSNYASCEVGGAIDINLSGKNGPQQIALTNDTFINNTAYTGGGGALFADNRNLASGLAVTGSVFRYNQALDGDGGAIDTYDQLMSIASTLFDSNHATDDGGALYIGVGGLVTTYLTTIVGSTFVANRADGRGGAIYDEASLRITNSTITANSSGSDGSALYYDGGRIDPLTIAASTINANSSDAPLFYGGAAIVNASEGSGPVSIGTSIVYNNTVLNMLIVDTSPLRANRAPIRALIAGTVIECSSPITDLGHNLSDTDVAGNPPTNSCGFAQNAPPAASPDILVPVGTDIGLGPLDAYGGPTLGAPGLTQPTKTEQLLPGSLALDKVPSGLTGSCVDAAGAPLAIDQRGDPRPSGAACDIGAYEVQVATDCSTRVALTSAAGVTLSLAVGTQALNPTRIAYLVLGGTGGTLRAQPIIMTLVCQLAYTFGATRLPLQADFNALVLSSSALGVVAPTLVHVTVTQDLGAATPVQTVVISSFNGTTLATFTTAGSITTPAFQIRTL